ncbi:MAG TPA: site-2 protease family protein [Candidatus Bathyarchaeia archaeon]|nr:site-2 protease family protein [Candidatus Bathyarchaeia archaeon]
MIQLVLIALSFLVALTIHEFAHAWTADKLGDPNPKLAGRLTLNPLAHLDPLGTVVLPLFLILSGSPIVFGWAKPVVIDVFNFRNLRRDTGLVSLAGPAANFGLAGAFAILLRLARLPLNPAGSIVYQVIFLIIINNVSLGFFNLLPIHPLDGGKAIVGFLPRETAYKIDEFLNQYGQILLIFLIFPFFGRSLISYLLSPIINFFLNLLLPSYPLI